MIRFVILMILAVGHSALITRNLLGFEWLSIGTAFGLTLAGGMALGNYDAFQTMKKKMDTMGFRENGLEWLLLNGMDREGLGFLPLFLSAQSGHSPIEQFDRAYVHGGGWRKIDKFTLKGELPDMFLQYPGDPDLKVVAVTKCNEWMVFVFQHAFVAVMNPDGTYQVARMD